MKKISCPLLLIFISTTFSLLTACGGGSNSTLPAGDTTAPVIESTKPISGANKESTNLQLEITFNETVQIPDTTNVDIYPYTGDSLDKTKRVPLKINPFRVNGNTLIIQPIVDLGVNKNAVQADTKYHVYLHGIKDKANNEISDCRWEFATADFLGNVAKSDKPCVTSKPTTVIRGLSFTKATSNVPETGTTPPSKAVISVSRSNTTNEITVDYSTAVEPAGIGKATVEDFTQEQNTLIFLVGEAKKEITILITDDDIPEPDETFIVNLLNPVGIDLGEYPTHTITITENDLGQTTPGPIKPGIPGTFAFTSAIQSPVAENSGAVSISVTRTNGSTGPIDVTFTISDGSAIAGTNYTIPTNTTVKFTDGDTAAKNIVIPLINDNIANGNKNFTVTLSAVTGGASLGLSSTTVTITDVGVPPVTGGPSRTLTTAELIAIWSLLL